MKIDFYTLLKKWTRPPKKQFPVGSVVFTGFQGSGKTLSMVKYCFDVQKEFPDCKIRSNVLINGLKNYKYISSDSELQACLTEPAPSGMLLLLDEAHLYFHKSNGIPLDVLTCISQQRKDRRRLVFSSQIWEELDISLRKQVKHVVTCHCLLNKFQFNTWHNGETIHYDKLLSEYVCDKEYTHIFKHFDLLYSSYDTRQKILRNNEYHREFKSNQQQIIEAKN